MTHLIRSLSSTTLIGLLACLPAAAGAVIEMQVSNAEQAGQPSTETIYAQGEMLKMEAEEGRRAGKQSTIFRDDRMWIVDHQRNKCQTIDKKGIEQLASELSAAMKQMEEALANVPPEQRAMMEKMMQGKMPPGMAGVQQQAPPRRVEQGGAAQVGELKCQLYTVYVGDEKRREVCATAEGLSDVMDQAMPAFEAVSRFARQIQETVRQNVGKMPMLALDEMPFEDVDQVGGFPIRVRTFRDGRMTSETTLKSAVRRDLDPAIFSPPADCKVEDLADQMKRSR